MSLLAWDVSALAKRYFPERGSDAVNRLFALVPLRDMLTAVWGYAETFAMLVPCLNRGALDAASFTAAITALDAEVVDDPDFGLLAIDEAMVFASVPLVRQHNLNTADAVLLVALLEFSQGLSAAAGPLVLVASDQRLLRAASVEGLVTLNPETLPATDVVRFLATL